MTKKPQRTRKKPTRKYLTKTVVDAARPHRDKRRDSIVWDKPGRANAPDYVRGFCLVVKPSGKKFFAYQYRLHSKVWRLFLGAYGELTVQQARERAREAKEKVSDGTNPKEEKARLRQPKKVTTIGDLCDLYIADYLLLEPDDEEKLQPVTGTSAKRSWRDDVQRIRDYIRPELGDVELAKLSKPDVSAMYRKIRRKGKNHTANRVLVLLRAMLNLAKEWEHLPENHPDKTRIKGTFKEPIRARPVKSEEWPRLQRAIDGYQSARESGEINEALDARMRGLFRLVAYTGLRASEVRERRWADVDFGKATLRLEDTKAGKPRIVPLSGLAMEILEDLKQNWRVVGSPYIFPSPASPRKAPVSRSWTFRQWKQIRNAADCPGLRTHDLRHSLATWMDEEGYAPQDVARALGHASIQTSLRYMHGNRAGAREALAGYAKGVTKPGDE